MDWPSIREELTSGTKQRLRGLDLLLEYVNDGKLDRNQTAEFMDLSTSLLSDNNFKVAQQALKVLDLVIQTQQESLRPHANMFIPAVVERLGDNKQDVRQQALFVIMSLFKTLKADFVLEKIAPFWAHKSWKIRHGLLETVAETVSVLGKSLAPLPTISTLVKQILKLAEDPDLTVRHCVGTCLVEFYKQFPDLTLDAVHSTNMRSAHKRELIVTLNSHNPTHLPLPPPSESFSRQHKGDNVEDSADSGPGSAANSFSSIKAPLAVMLCSEEVTVQVDVRRPASAAAAATVKRGGFRDPGGVTVDGDLPPVSPISIYSERDLKADLEAAIAGLAQAPNADWLQRMACMTKIEGLLLGGATEYECFHDSVKGIIATMCLQFKERRSSIARQACHLIGVLAATLGPKFEPHAVTIMPTLISVLLITVQVMAESAHNCLLEIIRHCPMGRVLSTFTEAVVKEKNPKARQYCAGFMVEVLDQWEPAVLIRQLDGLEAAIKAAAQDMLSETRLAARNSFTSYRAVLPERAQSFLKRLDPSLQDKLTASGAAGKAGSKPVATFSRQAIKAAFASGTGSDSRPSSAASVVSVAESDPGIVVMVPPPKLERQALSHRPPQRPSTAADVPADRKAQTAAGRKSMGLPPGRIAGGSTDLTSLLGDNSAALGSNVFLNEIKKPAQRRASNVASLSQRVPVAAAQPATPASRPDSARTVKAESPETSSVSDVTIAWMPEQTMKTAHAARGAGPPNPASTAAAPSASGRNGSIFRESSSISEGGASVSATQRPPSMQRIISNIVAGPRLWSDRVEAFTALAEHLRQAASAPEQHDLSRDLERIKDKLLDCLEEQHARVQAALLEVLGEYVMVCSRPLEPVLDRLMAALFKYATDGKEQVKALAADVLAGCAHAYRTDVLLPVLTKCLDILKVPRTKQLVVEFGLDIIGTAQRAKHHVPSTQCRPWLLKLSPLLEDKDLELRKHAREAVEQMIAEPSWKSFVLQMVAQSTAPEVVPLRRYMQSTTASSSSFMVAGASAQSSLPAAQARGAAKPPTASDASSAPTSHPVRVTAESVESVEMHPSLPLRRHTSPSMLSNKPDYIASNYMSPAKAEMGVADWGSSHVDVDASAMMQGSLSDSGAPCNYPSGTAHVPRASGPATTAGAGSRYPSATTSSSASMPVLHSSFASGMSSTAIEQQTYVKDLLVTPVSADKVERLIKCALQFSGAVWKETGAHVLTTMGTWHTHPSEAVRERTMVLLKELITHQPQLFVANLYLVFKELVTACGDCNAGIALDAKDAVNKLTEVAHPYNALVALCELVKSEVQLLVKNPFLEGQRVTAVLGGVQNVAKRVKRADMHRILATTSLMADVAAVVDHAITPVRKAVTTLVAELWYRTGHSPVRDYFFNLPDPSSHLPRLATIYYLRYYGVEITSKDQPQEHYLVKGDAQLPPDAPDYRTP